MATRKTDPEPKEPPAEAPATTEAPKKVTSEGQQVGGTVLEESGRIRYTREGAVSAVPGGPVDPTIQPGQFPEQAPPGREGEGGAKVLDRADAAPLTGDAPPSAPAKEEKK